MREKASGAVDEVRQRAPGVREDDLAAGVGAQGVVDDEVHCRPARLVRVVEHRLGQGFVDQVRIDWVGGVDEDDGFAPAEFGPDGLEVWVAEVVVVGAVAGEEGDAVGVEDVEHVCDLFEAGFGVEERGDGTEDTVAFGVVVAELGDVVVQLAGEGGCFGGFFLDAGARGGYGQDDGLVADIFGKGLVGFHGPCWDVPS